MLKILHTADWHLGHTLHGISRTYEHQCFLQWLLEQLFKTDADALIIAGDIFDSANPSAQSQSMLYDFLVQARQQNPSLDILLIGGNHDSASRLDAPKAILQSLGITVVGGLNRVKNNDEVQTIDWQRLIVPLTDRSGHIKAICGAMPFIRNADLPVSETIHNDNINSRNDPLVEGVAELYQQLSTQMKHYIENNELDDVAQILTGHCYMVGTELSELSERRILGGNQHALPASIFSKDIDYVALGHLHKAQRVNCQDKTLIHYSGSPLPFSFSEKNYKHKVLFVTLDESKNKKSKAQVESQIIPRVVKMEILPAQGFATLSELEVLITQQLENSSENDNLVNQNAPFLEVRVLLEKPEPALRQQIEAMLENKSARLLKISTSYPGKGDALAEQQEQIRLEELLPDDVFGQCYERRFDQSVPNNMMSLFHQLLESVEVQD